MYPCTPAGSGPTQTILFGKAHGGTKVHDEVQESGPVQRRVLVLAREKEAAGGWAAKTGLASC